MAKIAKASSSSQETATKLRSLLKEIPNDDRADAARLDDLRRLLAELIQQGDLTFSSSSSSSSNGSSSSSSSSLSKKTANSSSSVQTKWNVWLQKQHKTAVHQLTERMTQQGKRTAVRTLWGLVAASPHTTPQGHVHVHAELLFQWLQALVNMPINVGMDVTSDKSLYHLVEAEFHQRDVQYYALRAVARWANESYSYHHHHHHQMGRGSGGGASTSKKEQSSKHNSSKNGQLTLQEKADRMMHILMMIPFPKSQEALNDTSSQNKYLFPLPAANSRGGKQQSSSYYEDQEGSLSSEDDDDNDDDDNEESDHDTSNDEESSDDDDDEGESDKHQPPRKKLKKSQKAQARLSTTGFFAFQDVKCHLNALSKAWMAILRLPLSTAALKKALPFLSHHILPHVRHPLRFADFFMQAYSGNGGGDDNGGGDVIPLLALDGLFYLMTRHRLEYPQFYAQLYALLKPKLFYVKYRTRFFTLLQKCLLRNEMLPAHIVAAFLKRLLQCVLKAPPSGALFVLALSSNLLRQHEECSALIHRTTTTTTATQRQQSSIVDGNDEYDPETDDPVESKALQSSLWELAALERHYHPAVATLAKSIGREDPKSPMLQLDDMAQHTYDSLMEQERKRKQPHQKKNKNNKKNSLVYDKDAKATTPVTFVPPTNGLFPSTDVFAGILSVP